MAAKRTIPRGLSLSNVDKVLFPGNGFTKADIIRYYWAVAPVMLPHLKDRPITMIRWPDGVGGEHFYEKDAPHFAPDWMQTAPVARSEEEREPIDYILINDARTLLWVANLASIEIHPFLHRHPQIDVPTHIAFDLDPGEGAGLLECIEVAHLLKTLLAEMDLKAWPKVSGSKGLQLYVPLNTPVTYESTKPFAQRIAQQLEREHPKLVVSKMTKTLRKQRVLVDWSQNHMKKTTVAVYSLRGKRDVPFVSAPVSWKELDRAHSRRHVDDLFFTPEQVIARVEKLGDLFAPVLKTRQRLPKDAVVAKPSRTPGTLRAYAAKRDFSRTDEPAPAAPRRSSQGSRRRFVIQKHAASHLHYDLRLESGGTLKSWAVPKGMPWKRAEVRSAFETEDHPLEYLDFEGTIPAGEYGGGTVMVWDIGTYDTVEGNPWKGLWKVHLSGRKIRGEWTLKLKEDNDGKRTWLLIKTDTDSKPVSARRDDQSALTSRSMKQIARDNDAQWSSDLPPAKARTRKSGRTKLPTAKKATPASRPKSLEPKFIEPMLARSAAELPSGRGWTFEVKWDGYRIQAVKHGDRVRLLSRKGKDLTKEFPTVAEAMGQLDAGTAVFDGEIVALDSDGHPSFQMLQHRVSNEGVIVAYVFDLLNEEGKDWRGRPLEERKTRLAELVQGTALRLSVSLPGEPEEIATQVKALGLEGIIAKRSGSRYQAGERSGDWLKFKFSPEQEFVIGGYKPGNPLESLVVGTYEGRKLICAGKVRQGLNRHNRAELAKLLRPLLTKKCPFSNLPNSTKSHWGEGITAAQMDEHCWVKPQVVAQVSFVEWTRGGNLRHGEFKGLRGDKDPRQVVRELG